MAGLLIVLHNFIKVNGCRAVVILHTFHLRCQKIIFLQIISTGHSRQFNTLIGCQNVPLFHCCRRIRHPVGSKQGIGSCLNVVKITSGHQIGVSFYRHNHLFRIKNEVKFRKGRCQIFSLFLYHTDNFLGSSFLF